MENDTIKTIVPNFQCPHCNQPIIIEFSTVAPKIVSIYKIEDIEIAKKDAISRIEVLSVDEEKKMEAIKWIKDEGTIFGKSEVDAIVSNLLTPEK